jgi:AcrR family transcriptional regulator
MNATPTQNKGAATRDLILEQAYQLARHDGMEGLSIGALATGVGMSKSGVFAHFGSREDLQLALLEAVSNRFVAFILHPALKQKRGLPRLRAIVENWMEWGRIHAKGCVLLSAATEYDGREDSLLRERVVKQQSDWRNEMKRAIALTVEAGDFRADTDTTLLAFEIYSLMLGLHHDAGLFGFDEASRCARAAVDRLFASYRP